MSKRMANAVRIGAVLAIVAGAISTGAEDRIRPYEENPYFWQYEGEPALLLGGGPQENLFNHPDLEPDGLEAHLDLLVESGGNYVRNTMSRKPHQDNVWEYQFDEETGLYDLEQFNEEYWNRFRDFLDMTQERGIIVQIEVWERFQFAQGDYGWASNPFNPKNNVNYTAEESGLPTQIDTHAGQRENPFFRSLPELEDNPLLVPYQEARVNKMVEVSLPYPNVLYCISNETNESEEWSAYWARHIRDAAEEAGVEVHVTEMWDPWDLSHPMHDRTFENPELYTFVDISQNNHQTGQTHWNSAQEQRERIADAPRPMNNVKMYGGTVHGGGVEEGLRKLWRNVLGGMASARYHRPGEMTPDGPQYGPGLGEEAQAYLRSARTLMEEIEWPDIEPTLDFVELVMDAPGIVQAEKTHAVYTRGADGQARLYINGEEAAAEEIGGDVSPWNSEFHLALGNELTEERPWLGAYHQVAVYNRALEPSEIADHHAAGALEHVDGLMARYAFDEGEGAVVHDGSGEEPGLDLHIGDMEAVSWLEDGLQVHDPTLIATDRPAERFTEAVQDSGAFTLEAWITPTDTNQTGPARIVTLSADHDTRNFTLGQTDNAYEMRFRTTETSANGIPSLDTGVETDASVAAARAPEADRAAIFVSHGALLDVDMDQLQQGLDPQWFDPWTAEWRDAAPGEDGFFQPPSSADWLLVLR
ncbi:MAG: LamG-like jellyroll fold domain-containing protein [Candidatus Hydrogenedentota bacterium]